jgi:hypothetical protein
MKVIYVVFFLLGKSPASEFCVPEAYTTFEDGTDRMFRNVDTKFRRRGITQKKEYNIQNTAKV